MIECCHNQCDKPIWVDAGEGYGVVCSSFTCIHCRQMTLCLPHFLELYQGAKTFPCSHCGHSEWWVCLEEGDSLDELTATNLRDCGATFDQLETNRDDQESEPANSVEPETDLQVQRLALLPAGFVKISQGACLRRAPEGNTLWISGHTFSIGDRIATSASTSPSAQRLVIKVAKQGAVQFYCYEGQSPFASIPLSPGTISSAPLFVDEARFVFLKADTGYASGTIIEASPQGPNRIRSRRVAQVGPLPRGPLLIALADRRFVYTVELSKGSYRLLKVPLTFGPPETLAPLASAPRQLAASSRSDVVAWVDWNNEIRYLRTGQSPRLIGRTEGNLLAVHPDGEQIAWVTDDRIEIANLQTGAFVHLAGGLDAVHLYWIR